MNEQDFSPNSPLENPHHYGVTYYDSFVVNPKKEPYCFREFRTFWEDIARRLGDAPIKFTSVYHETSPDRGANGWRLCVGISGRRPLRIVYKRVAHDTIAIGYDGCDLPAVDKARETKRLAGIFCHLAYGVPENDFRLLLTHPAARNPETREWEHFEGERSILMDGPAGEDLEFVLEK